MKFRQAHSTYLHWKEDSSEILRGIRFNPQNNMINMPSRQVVPLLRTNLQQASELRDVLLAAGGVDTVQFMSLISSAPFYILKTNHVAMYAICCVFIHCYVTSDSWVLVKFAHAMRYTGSFWHSC